MSLILERLRTAPAILKILCMIFEIIGSILTKIGLTTTWGSGDAFCIAALIVFILTFILLILYMLKADNICGVNLDKIELYFAALSAIVFLVISTLIVLLTVALFTAGAIFGYLTAATYAVDFYLRWRER